MKVKVSGDYKARFDQAGIMLRIDHENYIKAGIEFVDGKFNLSTVVTHHTSDWSVIKLDKAVPYIWIKAVRRLDAVEVFYSFDDEEYTLMRNAWLQDNTPVQVGLMGASPDGEGFRATFEQFKVKHPARPAPPRMAEKEQRPISLIPTTYIQSRKRSSPEEPCGIFCSFHTD